MRARWRNECWGEGGTGSSSLPFSVETLGEMAANPLQAASLGVEQPALDSALLVDRQLAVALSDNLAITDTGLCSTNCANTGFQAMPSPPGRPGILIRFGPDVQSAARNHQITQ